MCGIFLSEAAPSESIKELLKARGPSSYKEIRTGNAYIISSVLAIRSMIPQPIIGNGWVLQYNGEIYNSEKSDTLFIKNIIEFIYNDRSSGGLKATTYSINKSPEDIFNENEAINTIQDATEIFYSDFDFIEKIYLQVNKVENELAISIFSHDKVYFFKDDIGRRSLGISHNPFTLSSVGYSEELDPMKLYIYDFRRKKLLSKFKPQKNLIQIYLSKISSIHTYLHSEQFTKEKQHLVGYEKLFIDDTIKRNQIHNSDMINLNQFINLFKKSVETRLSNDDPIIFFSGGVDSTFLALFTHMSLPIERSIYLVNTGFIDSFDRKVGVESHKRLQEKFPERNFVLIGNNLDFDEIKNHRLKILELMYPKKSVMDMNIATIHYFCARVACKYGKIVLLGSGADEVFGGYNKYKNTKNIADSETYSDIEISNNDTVAGILPLVSDSRRYINLSNFEAKDFKSSEKRENNKVMSNQARNHMFYDLFTISAHNLCRDDRMIANWGLEARLPFLDTNIVKLSFQFPDDWLTRNSIENVENKYLLRMTLRKFGLDYSSKIPKKAMQYGTGINKYEQKLFK